MLNLGAARKEYYFLAELPPLSLEIHVAMFKLEDSQPRLSLKYSRAVYEIAIRQFGEKNTGNYLIKSMLCLITFEMCSI